MVLRLIADFNKDHRGGISIMMAGLMPLFLIIMVVAYDFGRYFMLSRVMSSATQQTADWIKANDAISNYDFNSYVAKNYFDNLMQKHIASSGSVLGGLTSTNLELTGDSLRSRFWVITKANYNLTISKILPVPPFPLYTKVLSEVIMPPLFITIVFNAGEMQSEGIHSYGAGYDGNFTVAAGVSWSSNYYQNYPGQPAFSRTTPTHNYYMVAALVKELTSRYVGMRKLYMNIIPASSTINLNPHSYAANPPGSNETTLPGWIYRSGTFDYDNTPAAPRTSAICITNRTLPDIDSVSPMRGWSDFSNYTYYYAGFMPTFTHDYYRITQSELLLNNYPAFKEIYPTNWFSDEEMLLDNRLNHIIESMQPATSNPGNLSKPGYYVASANNPGNITNTNQYISSLAQQRRGYPFHYLDGTQSGSVCPGINSTPALYEFHQVTTADYPVDTRGSAGSGLSGNQIFWDYMRNYIDPAKQTSFNIWGSPNLAFGLQIAYEAIGHVQNPGAVDPEGFSNPYPSQALYDKRAEYQVFVVSDQIGGVKNAGGSLYSIYNNASSYNNYIPSYNRCHNLSLYDLYSFVVEQLCDPILDQSSSSYYTMRSLPANANTSHTSNAFSFTHMWWDSAYNPASRGCFANSMTGTNSCDVVYAATPLMVMKHFYNITNYALDLRYNKSRTNPMKRPKVYFIDTGSGKRLDDCLNSNHYLFNTYMYIADSAIDKLVTQQLGGQQSMYLPNQTWLKPCSAYAAMTGYVTNYNSQWRPTYPTGWNQYTYDASTMYEGGIISMDSDDTVAQTVDASVVTPVTDPPTSNYRAMLEKYAAADISASGFDRVYAYRYKRTDPYFNSSANSNPWIWSPWTIYSDGVASYNKGVDTFASKYLPIVYYDKSYKLQVRSQNVNMDWYTSADDYDIVDNFANAAKIASFVVADTAWSSPIVRPQVFP